LKYTLKKKKKISIQIVQKPYISSKRKKLLSLYAAQSPYLLLSPGT